MACLLNALSRGFLVNVFCDNGRPPRRYRVFRVLERSRRRPPIPGSASRLDQPGQEVMHDPFDVIVRGASMATRPRYGLSPRVCNLSAR
jgi:hypothetical protein